MPLFQLCLAALEDAVLVMIIGFCHFLLLGQALRHFWLMPLLQMPWHFPVQKCWIGDPLEPAGPTFIVYLFYKLSCQHLRRFFFIKKTKQEHSSLVFKEKSDYLATFSVNNSWLQLSGSQLLALERSDTLQLRQFCYSLLYNWKLFLTFPLLSWPPKVICGWDLCPTLLAVNCILHLWIIGYHGTSFSWNQWD